MSPIWVAMPTGPETGGAAVGSVDDRVDELARPPTMRPIQRTVWSTPIWTAVAQVVGRVLAEEVALERLGRSGDPERALAGVDLGRGPEGDRHVALVAVGVGDGQDDGLARALAQTRSRAFGPAMNW